VDFGITPVDKLAVEPDDTVAIVERLNAHGQGSQMEDIAARAPILDKARLDNGMPVPENKSTWLT
jgi:hypothetical protein